MLVAELTYSNMFVTELYWTVWFFAGWTAFEPDVFVDS